MDKKVYYGEYTLYHWIELILKHNIILPDYQRAFVWTKPVVERFLSTLDDTFVPPVIIGVFKRGNKKQNLILDGQQRLTSIILSYLGKYPKPGAFTKVIEPLYRDGDEGGAMDDEPEVEVIEWNFNEVLHDHEIRLKREDVLRYVDFAKYEDLSPECILDDNYLKTHYLGFSYIVPTTDDEVEQQKFYSTVFRNINQQGVELQGQESRRALYYLNADLVKFFEPSCLSQVRVVQNGRNMRYDFVRSMAFLSQYEHQGKENNIAVKCYRQEQLEQWYEDYINAVVVDRESFRFGKFSNIVGAANITGRLAELEKYIRELDLSKKYPSIIDADVNLFGLIYHTVIKGCTFDMVRKEEIQQAVNTKCDAIKTEAHKRAPNRVSNLRQRIKESITLYKDFANAPA